jgi:transposase InsO family protein
MIGRWKREYGSRKFFENKNNFDIASLKIRIFELENLVGELLLENKMLKKAKELDTVQKKRRFIDNRKLKLQTIKGWCNIMGISRSAYYYKPISWLDQIPKLIKHLDIYRPDMVWNVDITYIRILTGFVYLVALIDGFLRKIVGYALGKTLSPILTIAVLNDAISKRNTNDLIHHSDQGLQYCSSDYAKILKNNHIDTSM